MRRSTAAVLATAVVIAIAGTAVSAAVHTAVRAEVVVAGEGHPLDVRRIRIVDGLRPGERYRLPPFRIRNDRGTRTAFRIVAFGGSLEASRRDPRRWVRFVPAAVVVDAGRTHRVGARLELPHDAEPGPYAVTLGVRPGGSDGARLTFRVEAARTRGWAVQAASLAMWMVPALAGAVLVACRARAGV